MPIFQRAAAALAVIGALASVAPATAQRTDALAPVAKVGPAPTIPVTAHSLTEDDLRTWLDGLMPYALKQGDIAGAVVVVVKDGQMLLEKGYGYSDVARETPVSPTETLFRPGSISKTFTWTAVMQLVEQHKIDLDRDINTYLDFRIPPRDGKPITMRNLMQHTAGFGEVAKHLILDDPKRQMSIGQYLKTWTPPRIFDPGVTPAYSNYGATLAGYVVQRVSGQPFDDYIADHILIPLGMAHSTFAQPLPANLAPLLSKGYQRASAPARKFEILDAVPAGALTTSGDDMSRFMLAHLGYGTFNGVRILRPETAALMYRQSFQPTPPLPGMALGFYHEDRNAHEIIGHAGDSNLFHSDMHLFLKDGVGLFVSLNSLGKDGAAQTVRFELFRQFADRYFPAPEAASRPTLSTARTDGALMAGSWRFSRRAQGDLLDFVYLLGQMTITMDGDGVLTVSGLKSTAGVPMKWREVAPFVWNQVGGESRMAAVVNNGQVTAIGFDNEPPVFVLQHIPLTQQASLLLPLLGGSMAVLVLVVLLWPVGALIRRRYGRPFAHAGRRATAYRLARLAAVADVIFIAGMLATLVTMASALVIDGAEDWLFRVFQIFGVVGLIGIVAGPWNAMQVWRDRNSGWWGKLVGVVLALALIIVPILGVALHLLTPSLNY